MAFRVDRAQLTGLNPPQRRADGSVLYDAIATRDGVFEYQLPDGSVRREYRPREEVSREDSLDTLKMAPVVAREHTAKGDARKQAVGTVGQDVRWDEAGGGVRCSIVVRDDSTIADIANGMTELSCGYDVELEETEGVTDAGERYDAIQRGPKGADGKHGPIVYEHLAIVPSGRQGSQVSLRADSLSWRADAAFMISAPSGARQSTAQPRSEEPAMADKNKNGTGRTDCGDMGAMPEKKVDSPVPPAGGESSAGDGMAELKAMVMAMKEELAKLKGERDGAMQQLDAEKEKAAALPSDETRMDAAFARNMQRVELLAKARALGVETRADSVHGIQAAIVNKFSKPEFQISADDANKPAYVQGRYDAIAERIDAANAAEAAARGVMAVRAEVRADAGLDVEAEAYRKMVERNRALSTGGN